MDNSPLEESELLGVYSIGVAYEPYSLIATAILGPLVMQNLAAHAAFTRADHSIPCDTSAAYHCDVSVLGTWVDTSSLVLYCNSISVILQILLFIPIGSMADYGNLRRFFLFLFSYLQAICGLLILFVVNDKLWWLSFLSINGAGVFIGAASVFFAAYIPVLTNVSASVLDAKKRGDREAEFASFEKQASIISSNGVMWAAAAGLAIFLVCLVFIGLDMFLFKIHWGLSSSYTMQVAIAFCAVWQIGVLTFYSLSRVKHRPGPPLPYGETYTSQSFKSLYDVLAKARSLRHCFYMLAGWFVYSDSFTTVSSAAILFGQSELGAPLPILLGAAICVPLFAMIGTWVFLRVQFHFGWTTRKAVIVQAFLYSLLPLWGLVGFFNPWLGLRSKYELPIIGAYHGFLFGPTQSACRVLFAELIPRGHESQFFSLFGSSWIGPLVVAAITNATGSLRYAFIFLFVFFLVPIAIFYNVDPHEGRSDALAFHQSEHGEIPLQPI
ncbi:Autophagy protein 22 [Kappamyces sp. JEL0680]|nr:Autophagy protein 22 [Kappamyces sp. JEL0680]